MADLQNRAVISDIESTLMRLRGVASVRVVTDGRDEIAEIHVLADQGRHPKQIGRDIESALFSEFGVRIDHRKISIAQVRETEAPPAEARLKFLSIDYSIDRTSARARVSVGRGEDAFVGVASMATVKDVDQEELVARATLEAVQEFLRGTSVADGDVAMEIRDFSRLARNGRSFFVVTVRVGGERGEVELIGSALIRDDPWRAAAYATLDALNRRLPLLGSQP
jgi:hypothetical protein